MNARFLSEEEKYHATQRLAENRTGIANNDSSWKWDQALEAILDIKVWLVFLYNIAINIPNGGLLTFGSIIIQNLGFDALESSLLTMPFGVFATFGAWVFSFIAAKWTNRRTVVAALALLIPLLGTGLVYGLPRSLTPVQMFGLYLMYLYWRKFPLACTYHVLLTTLSSVHYLHLVAPGQHRGTYQESRHLRDR